MTIIGTGRDTWSRLANQSDEKNSNSIFLPLGVVQSAAGSTHLKAMREAAWRQGEAESRESHNSEARAVMAPCLQLTSPLNPCLHEMMHPFMLNPSWAGISMTQDPSYPHWHKSESHSFTHTTFTENPAHWGTLSLVQGIKKASKKKSSAPSAYSTGSVTGRCYPGE